MEPTVEQLAARLCHEETGLQSDPEAAILVAEWLLKNYHLQPKPEEAVEGDAD